MKKIILTSAVGLLVATLAHAESTLLSCTVEIVATHGLQQIVGDAYYFSFDPDSKSVQSLGRASKFFGNTMAVEQHPSATITDLLIIIPLLTSTRNARIEISRVSGIFIMRDDVTPVFSGKCENLSIKKNTF